MFIEPPPQETVYLCHHRLGIIDASLVSDSHKGYLVLFEHLVDGKKLFGENVLEDWIEEEGPLFFGPSEHCPLRLDDLAHVALHHDDAVDSFGQAYEQLGDYLDCLASGFREP